MHAMDLHTLFLAALVFLLAGTVKGVVGLGLPTIAMGLLALGMAPATAATLLLAPSFVTNVWQVAPFAGLGPLLQRLAPMLIASCVGTALGGLLFGAPAGIWAALALGLTLILYAAWGLAGKQFLIPPRHEATVGAFAGLLTGLVTAATGVFVVPGVPYLQALGLSRHALIQAMGVSFTLSTVSLALMLGGTGSLAAPTLGSSVLMLLPALLGVELGKRLRHRMSPASFKRCFMLGLAALGAYMAIQSLRHGIG
jgi:uncharacterized membrane protein YfcA